MGIHGNGDEGYCQRVWFNISVALDTVLNEYGVNATGLEEGERMVFTGVRQVMVGSCCPLVRLWTVGSSAIDGKVDWYFCYVLASLHLVIYKCSWQLNSLN